MKHRKPPDFHLTCNCLLQIQQNVRSQGMEILGLAMFSDRDGNTGLSVATASRVVGPRGGRKTGVLYLNYCPVCGSKIRQTIKGEIEDESIPSA